MSSRTVEMLLSVAPFVVLLVGLLSLMWWLMRNFDGWKWERRHTWGVLSHVLLIAVCLVSCQGGSYWYHSKRTFEIAQTVGHAPAEYLDSFETNRYKPGMVWRRGGYTLGGFDHGTAWYHRYETEGREISVFTFEEPAIAYIDVDDDYTLDGVGLVQVEKAYFPRLKKNQVIRRPTDEERRRYAALWENSERRSL